MRKKQSFKVLVDKNKEELLSSENALEKIERKLEAKHSSRA